MGSVKIQWVHQGGAAVSRGTVAVFARAREDELCVPACTCIESGWLHAATACLLKQQNKHHLMNWAKYVALLIALDWCDDGLMKVGIMARCLDKEMRRSGVIVDWLICHEDKVERWNHLHLNSLFAHYGVLKD